MNDNPWFTRAAALTPEKSEQIRQMLASTASKHGYTIYGTGGYVRDQLMGFTPDDFDVAVYKDGLDPEKAKLEFAKLFVADHGLPAPIAYGQTNTQFIDIDGDKVEVNNHGSTLEQDAANRDYTVNALFQDLRDPKAPIVDITGTGIQDAKDKVLRSADPRDPARLFKDSPERILRGIRFMASRGMEFEPATLEALKGSVELLADTAKENIGREFRKMLGHQGSPKAWRLATELGIAPYIVPEWRDMQGVTQRPDYHDRTVDEHTIAVMENVPVDLVLQLAAILHDTGKPAYRKVEDSLIKFHDHEVGSKEIAQRVLNDLGFPQDVKDKVVKLVGEHMRAHSYRPEWSDKTVRKLVRDLGGDVDAALALAKADNIGGNPAKLEERLRSLEELGARIKKEQEAATTPLHEMKPLLDGREMQAAFQRGPGKWIGDAQKYLLDLQLGDPNMTKEKATEAVGAWLDSGSPAPMESLDLSHETPPAAEEKKAGLAPRKADMPPLDQLSIDRLDSSKYWVWSYGNGYSNAQAYDTEAEADAVAAKVGRDGGLRVLVLTPNTIKMAKESPDRGQSLWQEIGSYFTSVGGVSQSPRWLRQAAEPGQEDDRSAQPSPQSSEPGTSPSTPVPPEQADETSRPQEPGATLPDTPVVPSSPPTTAPDKRITEHPAFVKAYAEVLPLLKEMSAKSGKNIDDPELWSKASHYIHQVLLLARVKVDLDKPTPTTMSSMYPEEVAEIKAMTPGQVADLMKEFARVAPMFIPMGFLAQLSQSFGDIETALYSLNKKQVSGGLKLGSSGFGHEAWTGSFYPKAMLQKDRLGFYAKHMKAVEITATRHSTPPTRVLENWAAATPADFVFAFCAPITVRPSNERAAEIMRSFMRRIAVVGDKLGPVVLHVGPLEKYNDGDAKRFFNSLPRHTYAVHMESQEWQNDEVLEEMLARNIAVVDTQLGRTMTDSLGWGYKRISADKVSHLKDVISKDDSNLVFLEDKTSLFPSKELMQALRDLGLTMDSEGPLSLIPNSMGTGGGSPTGMGNSGKSSGTEVADGISLETQVPNGKRVVKDLGSDVSNTATMSVGDKENNADGKAKPFGNNVDGKTSDSASYTDSTSGF